MYFQHKIKENMDITDTKASNQMYRKPIMGDHLLYKDVTKKRNQMQ